MAYRDDGFTVRNLCNRFLTAKQQQLNFGKIADCIRHDHKATADRLISAFSKNRLIEDLTTEDFEQLRGDLSKTRGHVALKKKSNGYAAFFVQGCVN